MKTYILTTGSHDSYQIIGVMTGPEGIDIQALARAWANEFPEKAVNLGRGRSGTANFDADHFRRYVIEKAGLTVVPSDELWLPDYSLDMKRLVEEK